MATTEETEAHKAKIAARAQEAGKKKQVGPAVAASKYRPGEQPEVRDFPDGGYGHHRPRGQVKLAKKGEVSGTTSFTEGAKARRQSPADAPGGDPQADVETYATAMERLRSKVPGASGRVTTREGREAKKRTVEEARQDVAAAKSEARKSAQPELQDLRQTKRRRRRRAVGETVVMAVPSALGWRTPHHGFGVLDPIREAGSEAHFDRRKYTIRQEAHERESVPEAKEALKRAKKR